ncbi:hypothetical protein [Alteromonas halophila]|uniref:Uncharacterized protein n=1 Tax=Alteromonas halophila TaxID=516698 RepID=A0A918JPI3_9ALTE|nr:hypothetical protein [Alteromonas halophila]GGW91377.1 hypothetical protein GCM10007391_27150 [Alteromonas halophila]
MEAITFISLISVVMVVGLISSYLDAKYQWRLTDYFNGQCSNPFKRSETGALKQKLAEKDAKIDALSERIATLEAIVTEPAYELKKQIDALK